MPSTPPWAADRFSEVPYSRSESRDSTSASSASTSEIGYVDEYPREIYDASTVISISRSGKFILLFGALSWLLSGVSPSTARGLSWSNATLNDANGGTLKGQVLVVNPDGNQFPPEKATVYLIYNRDPQSRGESSVGEVFYGEQEKVMKAFAKQEKLRKQHIAEETPEQRAAELEQQYLHSVDQALAAAAAWATRNERKSWQFSVLVPDRGGFWSREGLPPGQYTIIGRGTLGNLDAEWETRAEVRPGETLSMILTKTRVARIVPK